ncbi:MAG: M48 family metallopeptidase, partial [Ruminiclostridium sp.]|nr:M48 family metallopeptidase [Ruminiclostridium sp.]
LNCSLIEKTPLCIEYVVCHELAHFLQQDHSERFYGVLGKVMPGHRELKRKLNYK